MNYLVTLDAQAGELEKILSGVKTMLIKDIGPALPAAQLVNRGDELYFLKHRDECTVLVTATVVRVLVCTHNLEEDLSHTLKEFQSRLQLTEDQYNHWSAAGQFLLIECGSVQKIEPIHVPAQIHLNRLDWIPFKAVNLIME